MINIEKTKTTETAANNLVFHATLTIAFLSNDDSTIQSSFNHDELLNQMEETIIINYAVKLKRHTIRKLENNHALTIPHLLAL